MKILLHACCGPCAIYPLYVLRKEGQAVHGYFYNPNIHPYQEFKRRLTTFEEFATDSKLPVIIDNNYELEEFLREVVFREKSRCRICYYKRLSRTAQVAKLGRFDGFTTTLLVSPFQDHEAIRRTGEEVAEEYGLSFIYRDFRTGFKEGVEISKQKNMYRQQYCGCIYSEKARFAPKEEKCT